MRPAAGWVTGSQKPRSTSCGSSSSVSPRCTMPAGTPSACNCSIVARGSRSRVQAAISASASSWWWRRPSSVVKRASEASSAPPISSARARHSASERTVIAIQASSPAAG